MMDVLAKLWRGGYSLPMAFLGFYVFGYWAVFFLAAVVAVIGMQLQWERAGFTVAFLILAVYWVIASVGVWRSAGPNFTSSNWAARLEGFAARGFVLLIALYALWIIYAGGTVWLTQRVTG
jgi:hypothetical protein